MVHACISKWKWTQLVGVLIYYQLAFAVVLLDLTLIARADFKAVRLLGSHVGSRVQGLTPYKSRRAIASALPT